MQTSRVHSLLLVEAGFNWAHQYQKRVIKIPRIENWCSRSFNLEYGDSTPEMAWILAWAEAIVTGYSSSSTKF
jgi:hypothetical protein